MLKKVLAASLAGLAFATSAHASTLNFLLSLNDNGAGNYLAGRYAVYAYTSAGDNSGLASFTITTTGSTGTVSNRSPQATFNDTVGVYDPDTDTTTFGTSKTSGFTTLRADGTSGVATTGSFDTVSGNGLAKYGIGQTAGSVATGQTLPAGYAYAAVPGQTPTYGVTNSFTVANANGIATATGGQVPVLIQSGTFGATTPAISLGAGNLFTGAGLTAIPPTQAINLASRNLLVPEPTSLAVLGLAGVGALARRRKVASAI